MAGGGHWIPGLSWLRGGVSPPAASVPAVVLRDTAAFRVTYYKRSADKLVIVFISAGRSAPGEPVEEFRRTLERFDASIVFVLDRPSLWFNHDETPTMWAELDDVARQYAHVATIGESMGGCGAVIANKELTRVDRTLALSPQHSILKPFIDFDSRYEGVGRQIPHHRYTHFSDAPEPGRCLLLFGNAEWRDYMHSAMYAGHGFQPLYVDGANHNVAAFLKAQEGNALVKVVGRLLDWKRPFDRDALLTLLPGLVTTRGMRPENSFAAESVSVNHVMLAQLGSAYAAATGRTLGPNLALNRPADQSSLSAWSHGTSREQDAAGATSGAITGGYSFHTDLEDAPWWSVDLGETCVVQEVRLFNYMAEPQVRARSSLLSLLFSLDGTNWETVFQRNDPDPFGGSDGLPFTWRPGIDIVTRFVRVQLRGPTYLHLDEVQVHGWRGSERAIR